MHRRLVPIIGEAKSPRGAPATEYSPTSPDLSDVSAILSERSFSDRRLVCLASPTPSERTVENQIGVRGVARQRLVKQPSKERDILNVPLFLQNHGLSGVSPHAQISRSQIVSHAQGSKEVLLGELANFVAAWDNNHLLQN
eukprot:sb/3474238/